MGVNGALRLLREAPRRNRGEELVQEPRELPAELLVEAKSSVVSRLQEYGQGPMLIRRTRR